MTTRRFIDGIRAALDIELRRDPSVVLLGEDVSYGGPFGASKGLSDAYGGRVRDTPISEATVVGMTVGAALAGSAASGGGHVHRLHHAGHGPARQPCRQAALHDGRSAVRAVGRPRPGWCARLDGGPSQPEPGGVVHACAGPHGRGAVHARRRPGPAPGRDPVRRSGPVPGAPGPLLDPGRGAGRRRRGARAHRACRDRPAGH